MPTYEYRCKNCDETVEVVQAFTDDPLTECPSCGGELRKVFGNVGISFKGSGFYKTDSRSSSSKSNGSKSSSSSSDPSSSSSSSNDSSNGAKKDGSSNGSSSGDAKPAKAGNATSGSKGD